jgi:hypothetical protein
MVRSMAANGGLSDITSLASLPGSAPVLGARETLPRINLATDANGAATSR